MTVLQTEVWVLSALKSESQLKNGSVFEPPFPIMWKTNIITGSYCSIALY